MKITFDAVDAALYRLEVQQPHLSLEQLAARLDVSPAEVDRRRERMVDLKLLHRLEDDVWVARNPHTAADLLFAGQEQDLDRLRLHIAQRRDELASLTPDYLDARRLRAAPGQMEMLYGVETVRDAIAELARTSTQSVYSMAPGGGQSDAALQAALPLDQRLLDRGIRLRSLFLTTARGHAATHRYLRRLQQAGGAVRLATTLPTRMLIYDERAAVIPLQTEDTRRGAVLLHDSPVVDLLTDLFEVHWQQATLLQGPDETEEALSALERKVVQLMAAGLLDEVISRQVGLSVRTTRRIIGKMTQRLGANSRFQAGVLAVKNGWVDA
ncbi:LuxR C-terminal-related transcriptional regulator [Streptomyces sp. NBC_00199]|uniref:helix-turn-helix transcriptional regulator n=1 Tax=Streptomyces sp. NBC_00199 TaxID=2975678 RepID=UPI0022504100|nr:LuxR C-terminal-related transcriptional regulator [Streptomyces sp. NBC_00199]MCX5265958.1 LuxR C-terminal-related transcriptional regulator [Streptomyces sp. NBC_00199]